MSADPVSAIEGFHRLLELAKMWREGRELVADARYERRHKGDPLKNELPRAVMWEAATIAVGKGNQAAEAGDLDMAEKQYRSALELSQLVVSSLMRDVRSPEDIGKKVAMEPFDALAQSSHLLARVLVNKGQLKEAFDLEMQALTAFSASPMYGPDSLEAATVLSGGGEIALRAGDAAAGVALLVGAAERFRRLPVSGHAAHCYMMLGAATWNSGDHSAGIALLEMSADANAKLRDTSAETRATLAFLADCLETAGRGVEAAAYRQRLRGLGGL